MGKSPTENAKLETRKRGLFARASFASRTSSSWFPPARKKGAAKFADYRFRGVGVAVGNHFHLIVLHFGGNLGEVRLRGMLVRNRGRAPTCRGRCQRLRHIGRNARRSTQRNLRDAASCSDARGRLAGRGGGDAARGAE